jgi:hypothetical protein
MCVNEKVGECKGKLKTNFQYEINSKREYSCVPKLAGMKVKVKPENCIKIRKACLCLYIQFIRKNCQTFRRKGMTWQLRYQTMVMSKLDSVKNDGMFWVLSKIRKTILKFYFRNKFYFWKITRVFFEIDHADNSVKTILIIAEVKEHFLISRSSFFIDCTFKICPRQFALL